MNVKTRNLVAAAVEAGHETSQAICDHLDLSRILVERYLCSLVASGRICEIGQTLRFYTNGGA